MRPGGFGRRARCAALASGVFAVLATVAPTTASAVVGPCNVTDGAGLSAALGNADCDPINLAPGTYTSTSAFTPNHDVTIAGSGTPITTLTRSTAGDIFAVAGNAVSLSGVTISSAASGSASTIAAGNAVDVTNSSSDLTLAGVVITGNSNSDGVGAAGIFFDDGDLTVSDSVIRNNTATGFQGAGVLNSSSTGTATFNRVLFQDNSSTGAGGGGGISSDTNGSVTDLNNVTLTGNQATGDGGATRVGNPNVQFNLSNVTIAGNTADSDDAGSGDGGGIFIVGTPPATSTTRNSIIANNTDRSSSGNNHPDCSTGMTTPLILVGYNLIRDTTGCSVFGDTMNFTTGVDPLLGPLANNGGSTQTMALLPGSPAINGGNPSTPTGSSPTCETTDQRSRSRISSAVMPCDMGAFEVQPATCISLFKTLSPGQSVSVQLSCTGDPFNYEVDSPPHGTFSGFDPATATGTYTPDAGYTGLDSLHYRAVTGPPSDPDAITSTDGIVTFQIRAPFVPPTSTTQTTGSGPGAGFDLKAAIKRCKKKHPKGSKKRKNCIKKAKRKATR
jgi:hypothetical protein